MRRSYLVALLFVLVLGECFGSGLTAKTSPAYCDGPAPAYFMGIMPSGTEALTALSKWALEYQQQGGEIIDGEDSVGSFGWSDEWQIFGLWVTPKEDPAVAHPCLATFSQGATAECHYFVVRKESAGSCESCKEH